MALYKDKKFAWKIFEKIIYMKIIILELIWFRDICSIYLKKASFLESSRHLQTVDLYVVFVKHHIYHVDNLCSNFSCSIFAPAFYKKFDIGALKNTSLRVND